MTTLPAANRPQRASKFPLKAMRPKVQGRSSTSSIKVDAKRNSDQALVKENKKAIAKAGVDSGSRILKKAVTWVQPSTRAASSRLLEP